MCLKNFRNGKEHKKWKRLYRVKRCVRILDKLESYIKVGRYYIKHIYIETNAVQALRDILQISVDICILNLVTLMFTRRRVFFKTLF